MRNPVTSRRFGRLATSRVRGVDDARRAAVEAVEPRRLMAADIAINENGDLIATGTEGADVMSVERVGTDDIRVRVNSLTRTFDLDDINRIRLDGLGGNDGISSTSAAQRSTEVILNGGDGTDTMTVGVGSVQLHGVEVVRTNGRTVAARQADGGLLVFGTAAAERFDVTGSTEADGENVQIDDYFHGYFGNGQFAYFAINAGGGDDHLRSYGPFVTPIHLNGQDGNDFFDVDGATRTRVTGGAGNDWVEGIGGLTGFDGGAGTDTIDMDNDESGIDLNRYPGVENVENAEGTVIGNALNNRIDAGDGGNLTVRAGAGNDTVFGSTGPDALYGEGGNDTIYGQGGDDYIDGGPGTDTLDGGPGNDTVVSGEVAPPPPQFFIAADRTLTVNGTIAEDRFSAVRVGGDDVLVTVNDVSRRFDMDDFDRIKLNGGNGNDSMNVGAGVADVTMVGGAGRDRLEGNDLANVFRGGDGNDVLIGNGGVDALFGEAGSDLLIGGDGDDYLEGNADHDVLRGGAGADRMYGGDDNDEFEAVDGARDTLDGGAAFDRARVDAIDDLTSIEESEVNPA